MNVKMNRGEELGEGCDEGGRCSVCSHIEVDTIGKLVIDPQDELSEFSLTRKWTDRLGFGKYQYKKIALPLLSFMCDGVEVFMAGLLNYSLKEENQWNVTNNDLSALVSSTFVGMIAGSIFSGTLADKFGRRPVFIVVSLLLFITAFMTAWSSSLQMLTVMRAFSGVFMGGQIALALINAGENTPTKCFGYVVGALSFAFGVGNLYSAFVGFLTLNSFGWRYFVAINSFPCFVQAALSFFYPETPRYAEYTGDVAKMEILLTKMASENKANPDITEKIKLECDAFKDIISRKARNKTCRSTSVVEHIQIRGGLLLALFERQNIRLTAIHGYGWLICSFSSYGLNLFIQQVLVIRGYGPDNIYISTLINSSAVLPASVIVGPCVKRFGIQPVIIVSSLLTSVFALVFSMGTSLQVIRSSSWLYEFFVQICFVSFCIVTPLCFQSRIRGTALGFTGGMTRIGGALTPIIFNALISDVRSLKYPYIIVVCSNVALCLSVLFMKKSDMQRFKES